MMTMRARARSFRFPPEFPCQRTLRRRLNLWLSSWEYARVQTRLRSLPYILNIEPTNTCNLRCPFCFTGAGGLGRARSSMPLALYRKLLDELGDYVILLKAYGWGEPLLCGHLETIVADAHARGIHTIVNTNLSLDLEPGRIEALVASGLDQLVVSIDGARQDAYERYRVGGRLALVLENVRRLQRTKERVGSATPLLAIEFHPFPWNVDEVEAVRQLARQLDIELRTYKGCIPGEEWGKGEPWAFCGEPKPIPCHVLWTTAVIAADGGVAPCNGTFYTADDMGRIDLGALEQTSFRAIWNNERFLLARRFFRFGRHAGGAERDHVCFDCPNTILWERWIAHRMARRDPEDFEIGFTTHDTWNYFWNRRPPGALRHHAASDVPEQRAARASGR
jgi:MoaA/NifB/PqqE/SkfB family radical SAM enzyme